MGCLGWPDGSQIILIFRIFFHTHSVQSYFELLVQLRPSVRSRRSRDVLMDVGFFLFNSPRSSFLLFLIYFLTLQNSFPFFLFMTLEAVYFQSMASFRCLPQQQLFKQFSNRKKMRRSCLFNFLISSQEVKKKKKHRLLSYKLL